MLNTSIKQPLLDMDSSDAVTTFLNEYNQYLIAGGLAPVSSCINHHLHLPILWLAQDNGLARSQDTPTQFLNRPDILARLRELYSSNDPVHTWDAITQIQCGRASEHRNAKNPYPAFAKDLFTLYNTGQVNAKTTAKQLLDGVRTHHKFLYDLLKPLFTSVHDDNYERTLTRMHLTARRHFEDLERAKRILRTQADLDGRRNNASNASGQSKHSGTKDHQTAKPKQQRAATPQQNGDTKPNNNNNNNNQKKPQPDNQRPNSSSSKPKPDNQKPAGQQPPGQN